MPPSHSGTVPLDPDPDPSLLLHPEVFFRPSQTPTGTPPPLSKSAVLKALDIKKTKPSKRRFTSTHPSPTATDDEMDTDLAAADAADKTIRIPSGKGKDREATPGGDTEMIDVSGIDPNSFVDDVNTHTAFRFHKDPKAWSDDTDTASLTIQRMNEFLEFARKNKRTWDTKDSDSLVEQAGLLVRNLVEQGFVRNSLRGQDPQSTTWAFIDSIASSVRTALSEERKAHHAQAPPPKPPTGQLPNPRRSYPKRGSDPAGVRTQARFTWQ